MKLNMLIQKEITKIDSTETECSRLSGHPWISLIVLIGLLMGSIILSRLFIQGLNAPPNRSENVWKQPRVSFFQPHDRFLVEDVKPVEKRVGRDEDRQIRHGVGGEDLLEGSVRHKNLVAGQPLHVFRDKAGFPGLFSPIVVRIGFGTRLFPLFAMWPPL